MRLIVDKIEDRDTVTDGRQETGAIWCEKKISLAVDSA